MREVKNLNNLVGEDYFNMSRAVRPWIKALNQLDFKNYRYRYFTLKNPPTDKPRSSFETRHNKKANKNYEDVQEAIQELADLLVSQQEGKIRKEMYSNVISLINEQKYESIEREQRLFSSLLKDTYEISETQSKELYNVLLENTIVGNKNNSGFNNYNTITLDSLRKMTTIEIWTRMSNNGFNLINENLNGLNLTEQEFGAAALSYICQSHDIYEELKSKRETQIFSRHLALKGTSNTIDGDKISQEALRTFASAFNNYCQEHLTPQISAILSNTVYKTLSRWFTIEKTSSGYNLGEYKVKEERAPLATSVSTTLRSNVAQALRDMQNNPSLKGQVLPTEIRLMNKTDDVFFLVNIRLREDSQDFYAVMRKIFLEETGSDLAKRTEFNQYLASHPEAKRFLISTFFSALKQGINRLKTGNKKELSLLSLGEFSIQSFISAQKNEKLRQLTIQDFYSLAAAQCSESRIMELLFNNGELIESAYKSFAAADSNAFLQGLLGEISALFSVNKIAQMKGQMSGANVFSAIRGHSSYGQSVNDLKYKYNFEEDKKRKQMTFGVNVKRYASSKNEIEIYKSESGISVFRDAIGKYLGYQDTLIMRFMLENESYFDKKDIRDIGKRIAYKHIPEFYRVYDHDKHSSKNLFYIINNVCYPASYIYECILEKLAIKDQAENELLTFSTRTVTPRIPSEYKNYSQAISSYQDDEWKLQSKRYGSLDGSIKVNGLKINLVRLDLF